MAARDYRERPLVVVFGRDDHAGIARGASNFYLQPQILSFVAIELHYLLARIRRVECKAAALGKIAAAAPDSEGAGPFRAGILRHPGGQVLIDGGAPELHSRRAAVIVVGGNAKFAVAR